MINRIEELRELHRQTYRDMDEMFFPDLSLAIVLALQAHTFSQDNWSHNSVDFRTATRAAIQEDLRKNGLVIGNQHILFLRAIQTQLMDLDDQPEPNQP